MRPLSEDEFRQKVIAAQDRRAEYKYVVQTRSFVADIEPYSSGATYRGILDTLYAIGRPGPNKRQNSWMIFSNSTRANGGDTLRAYKVWFRRKDHAALFKLAWG